MGTRLPVFVYLPVLFIFSVFGVGQQISPRPLITQPLIESQLTTLKGNTHPLARPQFDIGAASPDLPLNRMLLVLKRSPEQEHALRTLLDNQQDKASPHFHKWLTPDEFGTQFGPTDQDLQAVTGWLQSHGFQVNRVSHGRSIIEFSGTEAKVEEALHTSIHRYAVNGEEHWANASDPQIPAALAPVVAGVWSLHDFRKTPQLVLSNDQIAAKYVPGGKPLFTSGSAHALTPADFYTIYNLHPLFGGGSKIAIVGRSNINLQDIIYFHYWMYDQAESPQVIVNGADPGELGGGDQAEAVLDTTWSGAVAPSAWVALVVSASTNSSDGVDLSEEYIIDNNLADVMSESFGDCEANYTSAEATATASLAQQAAAQGITYLVSSGDSGAEGCDNPNTQTLATHAPSVNLLASPPSVIAVGGTMFNENGNATKYWSSTNAPATLGSALSYIPETAWNQSCTAAQCGSKNAGIWAGGGGKSVFFQKPSWQNGVTGIPADNARDVPDVSLTAAGHDPYLLCLAGSCVPDSQGYIHFWAVSGTSASAPAFAGIIATVGATTGSRQGQANYVLYRLAASENLSQCNGSSTSTLPASTCVFNDVTKGNNAVPGETGYGTASAQFQSGTGYDLATGLGSINASNLLARWNSVTFNSTATTFSISPTTAVHGAPLNVAGTVTANSGTPGGTVWLVQTGYPNGNLVGDSTADLFALNAQGSFSGVTHILPGGTYQVSAHYPGDGTYGTSDSSPQIQVQIQAESTTTSFAVWKKGSSGTLVPFTSVPYGTAIYFTGHLGWASGYGKPSQYILFWDNGSGIAQASMNGEADVTTSALTQIPAGSHSITAAYYGDNSFASSSNLTPINFSITKLATITGLNAQQTSQSLILTATVNGSVTGGAAPTGQVTFASGNTVLSTVYLNNSYSSNGTSQATFDASQLGAGQYSVTASYSGDTNYTASDSTVVPLNLNADFTVSDRGITSQTVRAGSTATYINDLAVTSFFGFSGSVTVSCSVPATGTTCTADPAAYTLDNTTLEGVGTVSVTTTSRVLLAGVTNGNPNSHSFWWSYSIIAFSVFGIFVCSSHRKASPSARKFTFVMGLSLLALGLSGCGQGSGGGSGGDGGGGVNPNGTPAGTYTVTLTATSGSVSHSMTYTLNVQ